jgi:hypothetical protein
MARVRRKGERLPWMLVHFCAREREIQYGGVTAPLRFSHVAPPVLLVRP